MSKTLKQGFLIFLSRLTPNLTETNSLKSHRKSINDCLISSFRITNFFRTGSTGSGTSICNYSDTDYFVVIPNSKIEENSILLLRNLQNILNIRFPKTGIYIDSPAVICPFGNLGIENTEVVPARFSSIIDGNIIYEIPDGQGGWIKASPLAHNELVNKQNIRLSGKVKPLIRLIKAWKYNNTVSLKSFYLEMFILNYLQNITIIEYDVDIANIIEKLYYLNLINLEDPTGVSGMISPCQFDFEKEKIKSKLLRAIVQLKLAKEEKEKGKIENSFYWWNKFYNDKFPKH